MIYVLLVGLIIQLIYCYYVFDKDIFSPSAIICEVFILSTLACIFNISDSNFDIQPATLSVILGGNTIFILVSTVIHFFFGKKRKQREEAEPEQLKYIETRQIILLLITVLYLAFSVVFIVMSMSVIKSLGSGGDYSSAMSSYRSEILNEGSSLPGWLTKLGVIFNLGAFVLIYVFINNYLVNKKKKSNYLLLFCVIVYLISSVFTAQRTTILLMFLFTLFVTYSLLERKYQFVRRINFKYIRRGLLIVVVFLLLFGVTRGLFGRIGKSTAIDSVLNYTGNSIEFLDMYIRNPISNNREGTELFKQFDKTLSDFGLVEKSSENRFMEFRQTVKGNYGNIYTGYREYIHDYGYRSIIIFQILLALFFGVWYERISCRKLKNNIDLSFVFYAWFVSFVLFRFSITNAFFVAISYFVFTHWYVFLFWKLLLNMKLSFRYESTYNLVSNKENNELENLKR